MLKTATLAAIALGLGLAAAQAEGFLANKPAKLPDLVLGTDDAGFKVSETKYMLETGKAYSLTIVASGKKPYAMRGDAFFQNLWLRKIEVNNVEIKATGLYEIEMEEEGKAELVFVPIRPGDYTFAAKGLEARGTSVTFSIK
jgi:hypothetical protein